MSSPRVLRVVVTIPAPIRMSAKRRTRSAGERRKGEQHADAQEQRRGEDTQDVRGAGHGTLPATTTKPISPITPTNNMNQPNPLSSMISLHMLPGLVMHN